MPLTRGSLTGKPRVVRVVACTVAGLLLTASTTLTTLTGAQRGRTIDRPSRAAAIVTRASRSTCRRTGSTRARSAGTHPPTPQHTGPTRRVPLPCLCTLDRQRIAPDDLPNLVKDALTAKTRQREQQGYQRWRVRLDSVRQTSIGGRQALFAIADFERRADRSPGIDPVPPPTRRLECLESDLQSRKSRSVLCHARPRSTGRVPAQVRQGRAVGDVAVTSRGYRIRLAGPRTRLLRLR